MWDLEEKDVWLQPSISGAGAASLAYASALALCRALAEAVAQALAAAWHGGMQSAARFGLLPLVTADASAPGSSAAALEKQASSLLWAFHTHHTCWLYGGLCSLYNCLQHSRRAKPQPCPGSG